MLVPTSLLINKVFGSFVVSYRSDFYIEWRVGSATNKVSIRGSDQYSRGITIYGIK
jgi:hypothetical protein